MSSTQVSKPTGPLEKILVTGATGQQGGTLAKLLLQKIEGEIRRGKMMADITKEKNVKHLVYSSVANADRNTGIPHFESKYKVEQHIQNLGIPYTIIGPTFFMENLLTYLKPGLEQGQLALPLSPSSILQQIALENIAEFVTLVLERRNSFLGKRIDIASDELTGEQAR